MPLRALLNCPKSPRSWQHACMSTPVDEPAGIEGTFWLSDAPERRVAGYLQYAECAVHLSGHLVSPWVPYQGNLNVSVDREDAEVRYRVHAELATGAAITLPKAMRSPGGDEGQSFIDLRVLEGWPDGDFDRTRVQALTLTYAPELTRWLRRSAGSVLAVPADDAPNLHMEISDDGGLSFCGVPSWTPHQCEHRLATPMDALIALLTHRLSSPQRTQYVTANARVTVTRRSSEQDSIGLIAHSIDDFQHADAASWVGGWLAMSRQLAPSYLTAITAMFKPAAVQMKIFVMAAALERFYGACLSPQPGLSDAERRKYRDAAVKEMPSGLQERVRDLLMHLDQPSFAERLRAVVETLPEPWATDLTGARGPSREAWVKAVKRERNGTAHAGASKDAEDFDAYVGRLAVLAETLIFVVSTCYLVQAGISSAKVVRGLRDMSRFRLMRNRCLLRWPEIYGAHSGPIS